MISGIVFSTAFLVLLTLILRQRHRNAIDAAYCEGFCQGVAYEAQKTKKPGQRAVIHTVMSMN